MIEPGRKRIRFAVVLKRLLAGLALTVFLLSFTTQLYGNLFWMLEGTGSFFIPAESDIWSFEVTRNNPGSGSWWLFARDHQHYFALSAERPEYIYIRRDNSCDAFDALKLETWCTARASPLPGTQAGK
ncbi:hypothetical protein [Denitrobaculum tricleocarpae]|uniref:Uncharacterized protein n=1 Tax=Denitrobaculum tricleocarpae TaxID=2591009 RepID=A0A545TTP2_9PROT|nr:hypothetical protein [Denitrobaculum tricleocarpae]TQV80511.1 hypothetical protein FKG95_10055 [Denitrobaculum tricleocarpae]